MVMPLRLAHLSGKANHRIARQSFDANTDALKNNQLRFIDHTARHTSINYNRTVYAVRGVRRFKSHLVPAVRAQLTPAPYRWTSFWPMRNFLIYWGVT
eukprot:4662174-Pyramimonas_sp.AAC.1